MATRNNTESAIIVHRRQFRRPITMISIVHSIIFLLLCCYISITSSAKQQQNQKQPTTTPKPKECALSEFTCTNGRCVPLANYCDSVNNCGDSSDEPRFCTSEYPLYVSPSALKNVIP